MSRNWPSFSRRQLLRSVAGAALAAPFFELASGRRAWAIDGQARRFIVFYFPDGVPGASSDGEPSQWHARGPTGSSFTLPSVLNPLEGWRDRCVFLNGLSMGSTDVGSHPGGARKLLTAVDGGNGESIDQFLARTVASDVAHRHVYLGSQAAASGTSGDKFVSYLGPGVPAVPEDNPQRAFDRLFAGAGGSVPGGTGAAELARQRRLSVIDLVGDDLSELRTSLAGSDRARLDLHLEALREVEIRTLALAGEPAPESCSSPSIDVSVAEETARIYDPDRFPAILRSQIDVLVTAMACGLTRVGVVQASQHTSELIMSRFVGSEMYDPGYDMRSHQASHYGPRHNLDSREYRDFVAQRRWFVTQFVYLLEQLRARPEGDGTMLDNTVVLMCTEVADGNTHMHDNMPFVLSGGGGLRTGRVVDFGYERHSRLHTSIARAMGSDIGCFGEACGGPLDGVFG